MTFQPLRLLFLLSAAALEVTLLHLGVALITVGFAASPGLNWLMLLIVCLVAMWTMARFEAPSSERLTLQPATMIVGAVTIAYAAKVEAGGGWNAVGGWSVILPFAAEGISTTTLAALVIVNLYAWWRGMTALDHDHTAILHVLQRGVLTLVILALLITPLSSINLGAPPYGPLLAAEAIMLIGFGLLSLSLARISEETDRTPSSGWRWLRSSLVTSGTILLFGTILLAFFSDAATSVIRAVALVIATIITAILTPLIELLVRLWSYLAANRTPILPAPSPPPSASPLASIQAQPLSNTNLRFFEFLFAVVNALIYLLPIIVLLLVILFMRRRRRSQVTSDGALHESLWSWQNLRADLLSLLNGLRRGRGADDLRAALARLRRDDPAQRIRRRYIQTLLLGAAAERERAPTQTPLEYEPDMATVVPPVVDDLHTLTTAYDRARYAPNTIEAADADAADAAWNAIESQATKENR